MIKKTLLAATVATVAASAAHASKDYYPEQPGTVLEYENIEVVDNARDRLPDAYTVQNEIKTVTCERSLSHRSIIRVSPWTDVQNEYVYASKTRNCPEDSENMVRDHMQDWPISYTERVTFSVAEDGQAASETIHKNLTPSIIRVDQSSNYDQMGIWLKMSRVTDREIFLLVYGNDSDRDVEERLVDRLQYVGALAPTIKPGHIKWLINEARNHGVSHEFRNLTPSINDIRPLGGDRFAVSFRANRVTPYPVLMQVNTNSGVARLEYQLKAFLSHEAGESVGIRKGHAQNLLNKIKEAR